MGLFWPTHFFISSDPSRFYSRGQILRQAGSRRQGRCVWSSSSGQRACSVPSSRATLSCSLTCRQCTPSCCAALRKPLRRSPASHCLRSCRFLRDASGASFFAFPAPSCWFPAFFCAFSLSEITDSLFSHIEDWLF